MEEEKAGPPCSGELVSPSRVPPRCRGSHPLVQCLELAVTLHHRVPPAIAQHLHPVHLCHGSATAVSILIIPKAGGDTHLWGRWGYLGTDRTPGTSLPPPPPAPPPPCNIPQGQRESSRPGTPFPLSRVEGPQVGTPEDRQGPPPHSATGSSGQGPPPPASRAEGLPQQGPLWEVRDLHRPHPWACGDTGGHLGTRSRSWGGSQSPG